MKSNCLHIIVTSIILIDKKLADNEYKGAVSVRKIRGPSPLTVNPFSS